MAEELIHLTPSGARGISSLRAGQGWDEPVVISRLAGGGFRFDPASSADEPVAEFASRGVRLAVLDSESDYFHGAVLSWNYDSLFDRPIWWLSNPNDPARSMCSDPLHTSCSLPKFRELQPELFGARGLIARLRGKLSRDDRAQLVARTTGFLHVGDGRAAVVLRLSPLVVAAYCDEMDAAVLLRFPDSFVPRYRLSVGTPLVTANLHLPVANGAMAGDLVPGPRYTGRQANVRPLVADFLALEEDVVQARWKAISLEEYARCRGLGDDAMRAGQPIRSGRPLECGRPALRSAGK